jgi:hypothetical protein
VSHPTFEWGEALITQIRDELISRRHMLAPDTGAMCMLQVRGRAGGVRDRESSEFTQ